MWVVAVKQTYFLYSSTIALCSILQLTPCPYCHTDKNTVSYIVIVPSGTCISVHVILVWVAAVKWTNMVRQAHFSTLQPLHHVSSCNSVHVNVLVVVAAVLNINKDSKCPKKSVKCWTTCTILHLNARQLTVDRCGQTDRRAAPERCSIAGPLAPSSHNPSVQSQTCD